MWDGEELIAAMESLRLMEEGKMGKKGKRAGLTVVAVGAFSGKPAGNKQREQKKTQLSDIHIIA